MKKRLVILAVFAVLAFPFRGSAEETMTWEACLKESVKNNPDLISAEGSILQQNAAKAISASSLFPQVDASLGASTTKANTAGVSSTTDSYSYGIAGTQLFFDAFKTLNTVKQGNENVNAARYNFKFVSSDVRKRLRTAFVELLKAQESISVAEDIAKIRRGNYELITLRYASGL
ncbi:MAG: TolC family protein, partial [Candidatus Omnitrophica bacterium]|nr:TolC family protein [Candidatus Omnitrophota bacterium]